MDIHSLAATAGNWLNLLSQHGRLIEIDSALDGALVVERFRGHEAVCADYRFDIDCLSPSATLDLDALVAQPVALRLRDADGGHRHWHGWCTHAAALGSDGGFARYRLRLEPWTAFLRHRRNALVFQDLDVRGVLRRVFADYPQAKWRFDATQPLAKPAITTQFRESDHAFVTRLLADAGLAWRFEHAQSADGVATLVVFDRDAAVPDAQPASLRFHRSDATESLDAITAFAEQRQAVADAIGVASWQAEQVEATSAQLTADPAGPHVPSREVYAVPRAGRYAERAQAELEAELQLDALRLPRRLHAGSGSGRGVDAGAAFTLTQHPDLSGQAFVPLLVEHVAANNLSTSASQANGAGHGVAALLDAAGTERGTYRNRFLAVPRDTAIVPLPRPRPL
ncbi:type VI secretion system Vgr family protein, partial [Montanilutibacter psychrotolerans]